MNINILENLYILSFLNPFLFVIIVTHIVFNNLNNCLTKKFFLIGRSLDKRTVTFLDYYKIHLSLVINK